jgi:hypothetical protein
MALNQQRASLLISLGRREQAVDVLLTAAERAIQLREFSLVERGLAEVDGMITLSSARPGLQGRYHYAKAVLFSEKGEPGEAVAAFDRSIAATRVAAADDPSMRPWLLVRLFGKVFAARLRNGAGPVERDLAEVRAIIPLISARDMRWTVPYQQLAVAYYRLGEFDKGWSASVEALQRATRDFGRANPGLLRVRQYWLRNCLATGRASEAAVWLRSAASEIGHDSLTVYGRDPAWRVDAAEVFAAVGDWPAYQREIAGARDALAVSPSAQGYRSQGAQLRLLEARVALMRGHTAEARSLLATSPAGDMAEGFLDELRHQRLWILGIAARESGELPAARETLGRAERLAVDLMGETHPEVTRIRGDLAHALSAPESPVILSNTGMEYCPPVANYCITRQGIDPRLYNPKRSI